MIEFKKIKYKNFLSTGDNFTDIPLTGSRSTLIIGKNGSGKSTLLDAISFGLFGKAYRNINKPQLVNSVNRKDCVVEVYFNVLGSEFKVVRGIKPNIFQIWKDGECLNQESNSKDFQTLLENNILKLNHKSFHQIVVVGSSSFTPFMQLKPADRRIVIEDLLDISIFSEMKNIVKDRLSWARGAVKGADFEIDNNKREIVSKGQLISSLEKYNNEDIASKNNIINEEKNKIKILEESTIDIKAKLEKYNFDFESIIKNGNTQLTELNQKRGEIIANLNNLMKDTKFFEKNESCPTCTQDITEEFRKSKIASSVNKATELQEQYVNLGVEIEDVQAELKQAEKFNNYKSNLNNQLDSIEYKIGLARATIERTEAEITEGGSSRDDIKAAHEALEALRKQSDLLFEDKIRAEDNLKYAQALDEMMEDKGIKAKIIRQYLPVINTLVNKYLQILDFYVHFELTDSFGEVIKSRHRDNFSYSSFSEGEKQRIDLALLFTWREIANNKNSVSTNLLVLDETFDSSLDNDGIENLIKIVNSFDEGTNIYIISHKGEILEGRFNRKFEFFKDKNFSKVRYE